MTSQTRTVLKAYFNNGDQPTEAQFADLIDSAVNVSDDPAAHAPITLGAGSDAALTLAGQQLTLADILTPSEHTAIGSSSPHHAAITLDANADALLSLSTQALGLDTQTANTVLAGPASGVAAVPVFRTLTAVDLGVLGTILAGLKSGLLVTYTSATTIAISAGSAVINGVVYTFAAGSATFADLDTGSEAVGTNYYIYALAAGGYKISVSASAPTGYTTSNSKLIGWFHNNPSSDIHRYSVASGTDVDRPECGPKPGMVQLPGASWMVDIYIASDLGVTGSEAVHAGLNAATSAYNATPLVSDTAATQMKRCHNAGKRLCSNEEWSMAALGTPAGADNNDTCWTAAANTASHPTGTLPGCVSTIGCYDMTGNVWERVSTWYALTDTATDQSGWAWADGWTAEAEGGSIYTPFGANTGPDGLPGPRQWIRGGAWDNSSNAGGWAAGGYSSPRSADDTVGFRCCA